MLIHGPPKVSDLGSRLLGGLQQATGLLPANFYTDMPESGKSAGDPSQGEVAVVLLLSHLQLFATPWTAVLQAPLPMEFSRQGYWSGLQFPSPGDLPDPETEPRSLALQADSLPSEPPGKCPVCFMS